MDMFYFLLRSGRLYWTYLLQKPEMPKSSIYKAVVYLYGYTVYRYIDIIRPYTLSGKNKKTGIIKMPEILLG